MGKSRPGRTEDRVPQSSLPSTTLKSDDLPDYEEEVMDYQATKLPSSKSTDSLQPLRSNATQPAAGDSKNSHSLPQDRPQRTQDRGDSKVDASAQHPRKDDQIENESTRQDDKNKCDPLSGLGYSSMHKEVLRKMIDGEVKAALERYFVTLTNQIQGQLETRYNQAFSSFRQQAHELIDTQVQLEVNRQLYSFRFKVCEHGNGPVTTQQPTPQPCLVQPIIIFPDRPQPLNSQITTGPTNAAAITDLAQELHRLTQIVETMTVQNSNPTVGGSAGQNAASLFGMPVHTAQQPGAQLSNLISSRTNSQLTSQPNSQSIFSPATTTPSTNQNLFRPAAGQPSLVALPARQNPLPAVPSTFDFNNPQSYQFFPTPTPVPQVQQQPVAHTIPPEIPQSIFDDAERQVRKNPLESRTSGGRPSSEGPQNTQNISGFANGASGSLFAPRPTTTNPATTNSIFENNGKNADKGERTTG